MSVRYYISSRPKIKMAIQWLLRIKSALLSFNLIGIVSFINDYLEFKSLSTNAEDKKRISLLDLYPCVNDKTCTTSIDPHYFYMGSWAANRIRESKTMSHVDIASQNQFVGMLTAITHVTFIDLRPLEVNIDNLTCVRGTILDLPFENESVSSISCLSVAEHIGLGRYGDIVDPDGTIKSCKEIKRVLAKNGFLYFSVPIGHERICFNAHRIFYASTIIKLFAPLNLIEFSGVDDNGKFKTFREITELDNCNFACGMFRFIKL